MKTAVSIFVLASCALSAVGAVPVYSGPVQAVECRARSGIGNVMGKIRAGGAVKVAYFGGSITEMDGWRRTSREWLQSRYPACSFSEIAAAIGGTGWAAGSAARADSRFARSWYTTACWTRRRRTPSRTG